MRPPCRLSGRPAEAAICSRPTAHFLVLSTGQRSLKECQAKESKENKLIFWVLLSRVQGSFITDGVLCTHAFMYTEGTEKTTWKCQFHEERGYS